MRLLINIKISSSVEIGQWLRTKQEQRTEPQNPCKCQMGRKSPSSASLRRKRQLARKISHICKLWVWLGDPDSTNRVEKILRRMTDINVKPPHVCRPTYMYVHTCKTYMYIHVLLSLSIYLYLSHTQKTDTHTHIHTRMEKSKTTLKLPRGQQFAGCPLAQD
jgi:hypothetical protein